MRRLTERTDYVRQEISKALKNHKCVIPVLIYGAVIPDKNGLPNSIATLTRYQAFILSDDLEGDAKKLAIRIRDAIKEKKADDRSRIASRAVEILGMVLLYPFVAIYFVISNLVSGKYSEYRKIRRFLLIAIIVMGCFWLLYMLLKPVLP